MAKANAKAAEAKEIQDSVKKFFGATPLLRWYCVITGGHSWALSHNGRVSWNNEEHWKARCCTICRKIEFTKEAQSWRKK